MQFLNFAFGNMKTGETELPIPIVAQTVAVSSFSPLVPSLFVFGLSLLKFCWVGGQSIIKIIFLEPFSSLSRNSPTFFLLKLDDQDKLVASLFRTDKFSFLFKNFLIHSLLAGLCARYYKQFFC
ncbi:hypothetical protein HHI36_018546 [Cryptolaemus montrouzieri]|uniref:Uncharacterized protein n=1 Tax=Cryptolaemus montrouzieri TaxID=559131 RepID=A0ABD2P144_9CUCU